MIELTMKILEILDLIMTFLTSICISAHAWLKEFTLCRKPFLYYAVKFQFRIAEVARFNSLFF